MLFVLPPAQKAGPVPVLNCVATSGFALMFLIMVRSAGVKLSDSALRTSGRLSVMMATRSRITQSNSLVPVSIVISVVMFSLSPSLRGAERRSNPTFLFAWHGLLVPAHHYGRL